MWRVFYWEPDPVNVARLCGGRFVPSRRFPAGTPLGVYWIARDTDRGTELTCSDEQAQRWRAAAERYLDAASRAYEQLCYDHGADGVRVRLRDNRAYLDRPHPGSRGSARSRPGRLGSRLTQRRFRRRLAKAEADYRSVGEEIERQLTPAARSTALSAMERDQLPIHVRRQVFTFNIGLDRITVFRSFGRNVHKRYTRLSVRVDTLPSRSTPRTRGSLARALGLLGAFPPRYEHLVPSYGYGAVGEDPRTVLGTDLERRQWRAATEAYYDALVRAHQRLADACQLRRLPGWRHRLARRFRRLQPLVREEISRAVEAYRPVRQEVERRLGEQAVAVAIQEDRDRQIAAHRSALAQQRLWLYAEDREQRRVYLYRHDIPPAEPLPDTADRADTPLNLQELAEALKVVARGYHRLSVAWDRPATGAVERSLAEAGDKITFVTWLRVFAPLRLRPGHELGGFRTTHAISYSIGHIDTSGHSGDFGSPL